MTRREAVLTALFQRLATLPDATVKRNEALPEKVPAGGLLILRDGDPGEPEVTLSPATWIWHHLAQLEVFVAGATSEVRDAALDALLEAVGQALATDRTLGGLCDWSEPQAPEPDDVAIDGAAPIRAARVPILLLYGSSEPMG
jgi:hypothetical protein